MKNNLLIILCVLALAACDVPNKQLIRHSEAKTLMGTVIQLDVCVEHKTLQLEKAYEEAWSRLKDIGWRMNVYDAKSDISRLNNSHQENIKIGGDTYDLLKRARDYTKRTKGAFDITVWPLIVLWKDAEFVNDMVDPLALAAVKGQLGLTHVEFYPNNIVSRKNAIVKLDLGGIAKGYAIDEVARTFRSHEFKHFYIDAGGDVYVGGKNCKDKPWRIGIRDPREGRNIYKVVELSNQALATSGNYERYFKIKDKRYSHIIDPRTGRPQERVISASVIAPSAEEADVYATALTVLGAKEGIQLLETLKGKMSGLVLRKGKGDSLIPSQTTNFKTSEDN